MAGTAKLQDLVQRAMQRPRTLFPHPGPLIVDRDRACVRFSFEWRDGLVAEARYQSSTCATLLAFCEAAAERLRGLSRSEAEALSAVDLESDVPDAPAGRRSRAALVIQAIQSAITGSAPRGD